MIEYFGKNYKFIDNNLFYKQENKLLKVIDDEKEKENIITNAHNVGHEGIEKTIARIKQSYFWLGMKKEVELHIKSCITCQLNRPRPIPRNTAEHTTPIEKPFIRVGLDTIGPLPKT